MNENKTIRVNVQTTTSNNVVVTTNEATQKRVGVISTASKNPIAATPDTGLYYSQIAKNWAISEGLVENQDYSSKTYATQAKEYANESKMYSESANLDLKNVENKITEYDTQLDEIVAEGLANITTAENNAIGNIETSIAGIDAEVQAGKSEINTLKTQAVNDINTKTNQSITSIENKTQEGIEKIEAAGGGSAENAVTTNTEQTITANKTFTEGKQVKFLTGRSGYNGAVYGDTNQEGNVILECQNDSGNIPESVIVGAQGFGSNYTRRGIFLSHPSNEAVYVGYPNYACKIQGENDLKLYGGYKQNSYLTLSNDEVTYTKSNGDTVNLLSGGGENAETGLENKITNCITEIPQRIKLELKNGVLTLKAGSEVIVPNGLESDGTTPKFDYVTIESDISTSTVSPTSAQRFWLVNLDAMNFVDGTTQYTFSGNTSVMNSTTANPYSNFYNTETNMFYRGNGSSWDIKNWSLPIALITNEPSVITSIDQVFNGIGYIGSTVWVDKGVKGLIPNGRNADGTLNNIEWEFEQIITRTITAGITKPIIALNPNKENIKIGQLSSLYFKYDEIANQNINISVNEIWDYTPVATITENNGIITSFNLKQPFRAVDYSDIAGLKAYITETYVNGTSWYRVWSDGWIEQGGYGSISSTTNITLLKKFSNTNYNISATLSGGTGNRYAVQVVTSTKTASAFSIYCGHSENFYWCACGY